LQTGELGALAEAVARAFLEMKGLEIVETNYRFRSREIDIIAGSRDGSIIFAEVKFRSSARRGLPRESVGGKKRRHIVFAARGFLAERGWEDRGVRFDVIEIRFARAGLAMVVEHIPGAFGAGDAAEGRWRR
jgi:putative endonuclease